MAREETASGNSITGRAAGPGGGTLALAFVASDPYRPPRRLQLGAAEHVELTRGSPEGWERSADGRRIVIRLDDRYASERHAEMVRRDEVWTLVDRGSKNGTRKNGEVIDRSPLGSGDVIECGETFFVLRDVGLPTGQGDVDAPVGPHPHLRTLLASFQKELDLLARIARAPVPLLLRGETGTGKELAARAVHELSRREGPFVAVNCGALAPTLVAAELFGAVRGSYSGATRDREGLVRSAHLGTLFLDEIAELGAEGQTALLRVLQDSEVMPVGGTRPIKVDLRVIAATHQPLDTLAAAGRFRRDLLARLRGYQFFLPPLAERREDLGQIIGTLLERIDPQRRWRFRRSAARLLFRHTWPLHVRELEQALRAAVAVAGDDDEIAIDDLPETIHPVAEETTAPDAARPGSARGGEAPAVTPEQLAEVVARHRGNVTRIAEELRTSRSHVRRLARRHNVDLDTARDK